MPEDLADLALALGSPTGGACLVSPDGGRSVGNSLWTGSPQSFTLALPEFFAVFQLICCCLACTSHAQ